MPLYDLVRDLPLEIDGSRVRGRDASRSRPSSRARRHVVMRGGGARGPRRGRHLRPGRARPGPLPAARRCTGSWTLDSLSKHLDELELFPAGEPGQHAYRDYRRWAFESVGARPRAAAGRPLARRGARTRGAAADVRLVDPRHLARRLARALPRAALQARPDAGVDGRAGRDARGARQRRRRRPEGPVPRHGRRQPGRPGALPARRRRLPGRVDRGPGADAGDRRRARAAPRPHHVGRADPLVGRRRGAAVRARGASTASRRASARSRGCSSSTTAAPRHGIALYGGGQFELGVGRGQIQLLAALFHPDGSNDVAPGGYNAPEPLPGLGRARSTRARQPLGFRRAE